MATLVVLLCDTVKLYVYGMSLLCYRSSHYLYQAVTLSWSNWGTTLSPFLNLISNYHIDLFQKVNITVHLIHLSNELYTIGIFTH